MEIFNIISLLLVVIVSCLSKVILCLMFVISWVDLGCIRCYCIRERMLLVFLLNIL